jgi:hypothetical protein
MASGVSAISPAYTPRNHSGSSTSRSRVPSVAHGTPPTPSPIPSGTHTAASTATGRDSRASRVRSQAL